MSDPYDPLTYVYRPRAGYVVLSGTSIDLGQIVRNHLEVGWVPQGGVAVFGEPGEARFYQAMFHPDWRSR